MTDQVLRGGTERSRRTGAPSGSVPGESAGGSRLPPPRPVRGLGWRPRRRAGGNGPDRRRRPRTGSPGRGPSAPARGPEALLRRGTEERSLPGVPLLRLGGWAPRAGSLVGDLASRPRGTPAGGADSARRPGRRRRRRRRCLLAESRRRPPTSSSARVPRRAPEVVPRRSGLVVGRPRSGGEPSRRETDVGRVPDSRSPR